MPARSSTLSKQKAKKRSKRLIIIIAAIIALPVLGMATAATAMQFENHDDFCASCHSEPEATYYKRETAAPTDLASFHSTKDAHCIDCHSGEGLVPGRVDAMLLGARDLLAWLSGHAAQPAVNTRPIGDENCLKCHADLPQQRNFNNHFHVFLSRWQALDKNAATCVSCHQSHTTNGEAQLQFLNRNTTLNVCQACHAKLGGGD
jgi:predicted CXXCH cytochrome family protein